MPLSEVELKEAREAHIKELEAAGRLDPHCAGCTEQYFFYRTTWRPGGFGPFRPNHLASPRCESGRRPHCTCDTCF